jgi:addiction module RelB/DinJ family antitoxin
MKTQLLIKTDKKLKLQAQKLAKELGIPLSTVLNSFLKRFVEEKEVTFSTERYRMTPYLEKVVKQARKDIEEGNYKNFSPAFDNVDDAIKWLEK